MAVAVAAAAAALASAAASAAAMTSALVPYAGGAGSLDPCPLPVSRPRKIASARAAASSAACCAAGTAVCGSGACGTKDANCEEDEEAWCDGSNLRFCPVMADRSSEPVDL